MTLSRTTRCAALAVGCLLLASSVEARSRWRPHRGRGHPARAVRVERSEDRPERPAASPRPAPRVVGATVWVGGASVRVATGVYDPRAPSRFFEEEPPPPRQVRLGVEAQGGRRGKGLGLAFGLEEERWGIATRLTTLNVDTEDGLDRNRFLVGTAHVTFAAAVSHKGRLRMEGGVAVTRMPGVTFVGPSLAMSFERCLLGELDLEGGVQWTPYPQLQLDAQLGLGLHLGPLVVRGGWRGLVLNDAGYVDGAARRAAVGGPFTALGLSF